MANTKDIRPDPNASILLVGDSGTHKTYFLGTCPKPYVFDFDNGLRTIRGLDVEYDTFKEAPKGASMKKGGSLGLYEYGTAWPAFLTKLNEIGRLIDEGKCPYQTLAVDSLTTLTDVCQSYILKQNNRERMEIQDWGAFLQLMSTVFSQLTGWPILKVLTAHIRRMENDLTKLEEKLPLVPGQFAGRVPVYFDEVYYTEVAPKNPAKPADGLRWHIVTTPSAIVRQAKSRHNVPSGTETSYEAIKQYLNA